VANVFYDLASAISSRGAPVEATRWPATSSSRVQQKALLEGRRGGGAVDPFERPIREHDAPDRFSGPGRPPTENADPDTLFTQDVPESRNPAQRRGDRSVALVGCDHEIDDAVLEPQSFRQFEVGQELSSIEAIIVGGELV
jgi:hypothetical protein